MISALVVLSLSDLACGLSVNSTMLYIFRGLAGIANGGITSLSMMIVSDVVTLQERGKYQGILGAMIGLGNAVGPLIAAAFAIHATWRGLFYLLAPLTMAVVFACWRCLPSNMPKLNLRETISKIDFLGLLTGTAAVVLLLIPTSEGGHAGTPWDSPLVIAMFTVGGICFSVFLLVEWRWAALPMMPLSMFRKASVAAMLAQSFLLGAAYYTYLYFVPLYFQNVRGYSPLISAALQLPFAITQSSVSTCAGYCMSRFNRYVEIIWIGFGTWTLGAGLLILADDTIHIGLVSFFLVVVGTGTGCVFQPTLVALQAHCPKAQRAVVVSNRNFLRSSGAAVGLAVSSAILANVLKGSLPAHLSAIANSTFAPPDISGYSASDQAAIKAAYTAASRAVFTWCVPVTVICFLLTAVIKDRGLVRKEEREAATPPVLEPSDLEEKSPGQVEEGKAYGEESGAVVESRKPSRDLGSSGSRGGSRTSSVVSEKEGT